MTLVDRVVLVSAAFFFLATGYGVSVHVLPEQWVAWVGYGLSVISAVAATILLALSARPRRGRHRESST